MEVKGQPYPRIFAQHFHIILQNPASAFAETGFFYAVFFVKGAISHSQCRYLIAGFALSILNLYGDVLDLLLNCLIKLFVSLKPTISPISLTRLSE